MELLKARSHGSEQPRISELTRLFNQMVSELRHVTVVLDALDESSEKRDLLHWITSSAHQKCKFVLMSRSEREIEESLAMWLSLDCTLTLENEPVDADIKAYVQHRLGIETNLSRWRSMHDRISTILVEKAGGMWVALLLPC